MYGILPFVIICLLLSCSYRDKHFQLNDNEKAMFASFRKGDTLYYENKHADIDTFLVLGIDSFQKRETGYLMQSEAYNTIWVAIKQLPVDTFGHTIVTNETTGYSDTSYTELFTIEKFPQREKVQYSFSFMGFSKIFEDSIGQLQQPPITLNGRVLKDYYVIKNNQVASGNPIEALYWTHEKGLVAYQFRDGSVWTRKQSGNK